MPSNEIINEQKRRIVLFCNISFQFELGRNVDRNIECNYKLTLSKDIPKIVSKAACV